MARRRIPPHRSPRTAAPDDIGGILPHDLIVIKAKPAYDEQKAGNSLGD
jgi:hypothetical protein